jgi:hypothetical protein
LCHSETKSHQDWTNLAISGINPDAYEFYHKFFFYLTCLVEFEISYAHAQHNRYDPWVTRINHDLAPALSDDGSCDRRMFPEPRKLFRRKLSGSRWNSFLVSGLRFVCLNLCAFA